MRFEQYLNKADGMKNMNEAWDKSSPEYKLFMRFMDVRNKADKMNSQMQKMGDEIGRIQKQMKKNGMDELLNHKDNPILNIDDEGFDVVWSMFSNR